MLRGWREFFFSRAKTTPAVFFCTAPASYLRRRTGILLPVQVLSHLDCTYPVVFHGIVVVVMADCREQFVLFFIVSTAFRLQGRFFIDTARLVCGAGYMKRSGVCLSVRPSVRLSHRSTAAAARLQQARRATSAVQQAPTLSSKCGQRHVASWRRKLNTDLFFFYMQIF